MALYNTDENVFIGCPTGSGKTVCAEFAMLRVLSREGRNRIVYIAPNEDIAQVSHLPILECDGRFEIT